MAATVNSLVCRNINIIITSIYVAKFISLKCLLRRTAANLEN